MALVVEDARSTNRIRIYSLRGEPQKDVVVENATHLVKSRLERHRSRLLLHKPNTTPAMNCCSFD